MKRLSSILLLLGLGQAHADGPGRVIDTSPGVVFGGLAQSSPPFYVAAKATTGQRIASSETGVSGSWSSRTLGVCGATEAYLSVAYGNGRFCSPNSSVAVQTASAYALDGINWQCGGNMPSNRLWGHIAYGNGVFCTLGKSTAGGAYSTDCITWNASSTPPPATAQGIVFDGTRFVAAFTTTAGTIAVSTDCDTWTTVATGISGNGLGGISWSASLGKYVASQYQGAAANVFTSSDAVTWSTISVPFLVAAMACSPSSCVGVGEAGNAVYSTDGITWNTATMDASSPDFRSLCGVATNSNLIWDGSKYIAVGDAATAVSGATSLDGSVWTNSTLVTLDSYCGVGFKP